jgi:hypothetical protein
MPPAMERWEPNIDGQCKKYDWFLKRRWPNNVGDGVEEMLRRNFPKLAFAKSDDDAKKALAENDFLLHGSPSLVAERKVARWREEAGKTLQHLQIRFTY